MIDMEDVGHAADGPGGIGLAPDRLPQRERGLQGRGGSEEDAVPGDGARVIVEHEGQPGPGRRAAGVQHEDVEQGMIGLPDGIRPLGAVTVDQFEAVPIRRGPVMGERDESRVECARDRMNGGIGRHRPRLRPGHRGDAPMNGRRGEARLAEGKALDHRHQVRSQTAFPGIRAPAACETRDAGCPVARRPSLQAAQGKPGIPCRLGEGDAVQNMRTDRLEPAHRVAALGLRQAGEAVR